MGLPQISIEFKSVGITAVQRGERGIVALVVKDAGFGSGRTTLYSVDDTPAGASADTKREISQAFIGYQNPPLRVELYNEDSAEVDHSKAFTALETIKFDYVAFASLLNGQDTNVVNWIKSMRDNMSKKVKVVLPNKNADYEGVVNFTAENIKVGNDVFTAKQYCSRIAGLLAGTPLQISATYAPLPEVDDVKRFTKSELDAKIDAGEFVLFHDGEKVKVGRAVNSLVTTTQDKGESYKKCKVVDIQDLMYTDIKATAEDSYIGKYANSYDNKVLLISAINGYLLTLEADGLLEAGQNRVEINLVAQRNYLISIGVDVSRMTDQEIKEANTKDKVFLGGRAVILDAIEDISLDMAI